jgi:hypothetical protein
MPISPAAQQKIDDHETHLKDNLQRIHTAVGKQYDFETDWKYVLSLFLYLFILLLIMCYLFCSFSYYLIIYNGRKYTIDWMLLNDIR